jgi:hypothetical protein
MIAETLIPRTTFKDSLAVHGDPCFLETLYSTSGKINATVVKVVTDRDLQKVQDEQFIRSYVRARTNAVQFFIAHTCPTYEDVSTS